MLDRTLYLQITPASRLPSIDDLDAQRELRQALGAIDGTRVQTGTMMTPSALTGEPQNAIDWSILLVDYAAIPSAVAAGTLTDVLVSWLTRRRNKGDTRALIIRTTNLEIRLEGVSDAERMTLLQFLVESDHEQGEGEVGRDGGT